MLLAWWWEGVCQASESVASAASAGRPPSAASVSSRVGRLPRTIAIRPVRTSSRMPRGRISSMKPSSFFSVPEISTTIGWQTLFACLPIAFAGLVSAIFQGKVCSGGILMAAKRPEMAFKAGVVYAVMVEVYAVLGLLVTMFMLLFGIAWPEVAAAA